MREGDRTAPKMMRSIVLGARVVEGVSRLSLIISKKLVIVRFNSFRHLLRFKLRKCHLPREGGLGYFIDTLKASHLICFLFPVTSVAAVSRFRRKSQICLKTRAWGDIAWKNNRSGCFSCANPTSHARRAHNQGTFAQIFPV